MLDAPGAEGENSDEGYFEAFSPVSLFDECEVDAKSHNEDNLEDMFGGEDNP